MTLKVLGIKSNNSCVIQQSTTGCGFFFGCCQRPSHRGGRAVEEIERETCRERERERERERNVKWREKESAE